MRGKPRPLMGRACPNAARASGAGSWCGCASALSGPSSMGTLPSFHRLIALGKGLNLGKGQVIADIMPIIRLDNREIGGQQKIGGQLQMVAIAALAQSAAGRFVELRS